MHAGAGAREEQDAVGGAEDRLDQRLGCAPASARNSGPRWLTIRRAVAWRTRSGTSVGTGQAQAIGVGRGNGFHQAVHPSAGFDDRNESQYRGSLLHAIAAPGVIWTEDMAAQRVVGSSRSRTQSPMRLTASVVRESTAPGSTAIHHALTR